MLPTGEQKLSWEQAAAAALEQFGIAYSGLDWLAFTHNAVFRVQMADGALVLRLSPLDERRVLLGESEVLWLRAVQAAGLHVPPPLAYGAVPAYAVYALLARHLPGETRPADSVTPEDLRRVGTWLGRLHTFSTQFIPPPGFTRPRLDAEGLFGAGGVYDPGAGAQLFSAAQQQIFAQVAARVAAAMAAATTAPDTGRGVFGMIHGDLLLKNILFTAGDIAALDWEYCGWGDYLYDLTPLLWQLRDHPQAAALDAGLRAGYSAVRPLDIAQHAALETLLAGRHLASIRWIAANREHPAVAGRAAEIIAGRSAELQAFLHTGRLARRGQTF